jgi:hypothetical protein
MTLCAVDLVGIAGAVLGAVILAAYRIALRGDIRALRVVGGTRLISALLGLQCPSPRRHPLGPDLRGCPRRRYVLAVTMPALAARFTPAGQT